MVGNCQGSNRKKVKVKAFGMLPEVSERVMRCALIYHRGVHSYCGIEAKIAD